MTASCCRLLYQSSATSLVRERSRLFTLSHDHPLFDHGGARGDLRVCQDLQTYII